LSHNRRRKTNPDSCNNGSNDVAATAAAGELRLGIKKEKREK
jgi:hypothetical protein